MAAPRSVSDRDGTDTGHGRHSTHSLTAAIGELLNPFRILLGNRALTWLVLAFAAVTTAEW
jgi:hypothetical protein